MHNTTLYSSMAEVSQILDQLTDEFLTVHTRKEDLFWETKMGLGQDPKASQNKLSQAEIAAQQFIHDATKLKTLREIEPKATSKDDIHAVKGWINMFSANAIEDPK